MTGNRRSTHVENSQHVLLSMLPEDITNRRQRLQETSNAEFMPNRLSGHRSGATSRGLIIRGASTRFLSVAVFDVSGIPEFRYRRSPSHLDGQQLTCPPAISGQSLHLPHERHTRYSAPRLWGTGRLTEHGAAQPRKGVR